MTAQHNKKRRPAEVAIDDLVWLATGNLSMPAGLSRKLAAKWIGPYKVLAKVGPVAVRLELPVELQKLHPVFHVSMVKKAVGEPWQKEPTFRSNTYVVEYEVQKVMAKRLRAN